MAGIDNNTVLYLRGDSFTDLSPHKLTVVNNDAIITDGVIDCTDGKTLKVLNHEKLNFKDTSFTIDFDILILKKFGAWGKVFDKGGVASKNITQYKLEYYNSSYIFYLGDGKTDGYIGNISLPESNISLGSWKHIELSYNREFNKIYYFVDGKLFNSKTINGVVQNLSSESDLTIGYQNQESASGSFKLKNFRISNICRHTEDFTPPTQPYNSITINKTNQTDTNIEFNIEKLGSETINKVEVLVNNIVSETYTDNYDNINYLIDTELCMIGNNDITIRVTYNDTYTEELSLNHNVTVDELPLETPLLDTVERVKLLTKLKQVEKTMLSSILTSKNVEVSEEDKMSDLIDKVDLLDEYDGGKLWLYKDGEGVSNISKTNITGVAPPTVNIQTNCIYISSNVSNSDRHISINTSNKIDLTKYSKFNVEYSCNIKAHNEGYNKFGLGAIEQVSFSGTNAWRDNSVVNLEIAPRESDLVVEKNIATLNIGNVSDSYFIFVYYGMYNGSNNATIHKIWLEK